MNRARIEALWAKNPKLTIEQVRKATGAPGPTVRHVYRQLLAARKLERPKHVGHDYLRAV